MLFRLFGNALEQAVRHGHGVNLLVYFYEAWTYRPSMTSILSALQRPMVLRAAAVVVGVGAPALWAASCERDAIIGEEELASIGSAIALGETTDGVVRVFKRSAHSKVEVFDDGRLVDGEMLIATPSQLRAENSVLHVGFDEGRRVRCVAFRTEDSAWVHPPHMPADRGCTPGDRRLYRIASAP